VLIHPSHVKIANEAFAPSSEEVEYFAGLIEAMREGERMAPSQVNRYLVMLSISGFGQTGPESSRPGFGKIRRRSATLSS
jgi:hypothetical protein